MINIDNLKTENQLLREYVIRLQRVNEQKIKEIIIKNNQTNKQSQQRCYNGKLKLQKEINDRLCEDLKNIKSQMQKHLKQKKQLQEKNKNLAQQLRILQKNLKNQLFKNSESSRNKNSVSQTNSRFSSDEPFTFANDTKIHSIDHAFRQRVKQLEIQLNTNKTNNKKTQDLLVKITELQSQNHLQQIEISTNKLKIEELEKHNIEQKNEFTLQINKLNQKNEEIIEQNNNQLYKLSQSYNNKINTLMHELERYKQLMQQIQGHQQWALAKTISLEEQKQKLFIQLEQREGIIQFLKQENHSLHQSISRIKQQHHKQIDSNRIKEQNSHRNEYNNSVLRVNQNNIKQNTKANSQKYRYPSPQIKSKKQQYIDIQNQKQKNHKGILINPKNTPFFTKPTHQHTPTHILTHKTEIKSPKLNQDLKKHMHNVTWNCKNINTFSNSPSSPLKRQINPKVHVFKHIVKPVSEFKLNLNQQETIRGGAGRQNNTNGPLSFINTLIEELPESQQNHNWEEVQKRLNYLRKENSNLKKTLFD